MWVHLPKDSRVKRNVQTVCEPGEDNGDIKQYSPVIIVGLIEGSFVGSSVMKVGIIVGSFVGSSVKNVGDIVGSSVMNDGDRVGYFVGSSVRIVGDNVGSQEQQKARWVNKQANLGCIYVEFLSTHVCRDLRWGDCWFGGRKYSWEHSGRHLKIGQKVTADEEVVLLFTT